MSKEPVISADDDSKFSNAQWVAQLVHECNRAYCAMNGDTSHLPWAETPDNIKASAIDGVKNPQSDPEAQHNKWLAFKEADGWVYGPEKDLEQKTHPCMVPYHELPANDRFKDYLFKAIVKAADDFHWNELAADAID